MRYRSKIFLAVGVVAFLLEFTSAPMFHDHPADLKEHSDCPAHVFSSNAVGDAPVQFDSPDLIPPQEICIKSEETESCLSKTVYSTKSKRAPPQSA